MIDFRLFGIIIGIFDIVIGSFGNFFTILAFTRSDLNPRFYSKCCRLLTKIGENYRFLEFNWFEYETSISDARRYILPTMFSLSIFQLLVSHPLSTKSVNNNIHQNEFLDFLTATCMMPLNVTGYILKRWPLGGPDHISCSIQARDHRTGSLDRYRNLDRSRTNFNQAVREFLISLCVFLLWIYFHRLPPCYHYQ